VKILTLGFTVYLTRDETTNFGRKQANLKGENIFVFKILPTMYVTFGGDKILPLIVLK